MFPYTARDVLDRGGLWCLGVVLHVRIKLTEDLFKKRATEVKFLLREKHVINREKPYIDQAETDERVHEIEVGIG